MTQPKLYFAPGACSRVPLVMLEKTETAFEAELVVFMRGDHRSSEFMSLNPAGKIPVLQTGNEAISQNPAILLWLHTQYPRSQILHLGQTELERSQVLSELLRFSSDLHPLVTRIRMPQFFCDLEGGPGRVKEMAEVAISSQLASYETVLSQQKWIGGEEWSALDAYLHWVWFRITGAGFDPTPFPAILAHYQRTLEISAFQRAIERERKAQAWLDENGFSIKFVQP
ncbi:MAG: glutathione S-transferase family protein [Henriciella sp.]|uniref:glutathione S-transferase family protein n=1 Tax=Henriciella sp. TaxID=1968823 RepID=UPI003C73EC16